MQSFTKILRQAGRSAAIAASLCLLFMAGCDPDPPAPSVPSSNLLKDVYEDYFSVGAAVQSGSLGKYETILENFNSVTAETQMKWSRLEAEEGTYTYEGADAIIDWAQSHDTAVRGHCLVWYKSLPAWVLADGTTKEEALARIDRHVAETMEHFGSDVYCWDVVNEALKDTVTAADLERGTIWRTGDISGAETGDWYALCGTDYITQAFRSAAAAREEYGLDGVELFYNDYKLNDPAKREACVQVVEMLREEGLPVDGIGMQGHYRLSDYLADPEGFLDEFETSVKTFTGLGLDVHITELDIRVYASDDEPQEFDSLPYAVEEQQAEMYAGIFEVLRKYAAPWKDGAGCVTNVTVWGLADDSRAWDTAAHKEYPLLFNEALEPKQAYYAIISF